MKRNIVIAAVTTAALIGGGTATALAVNGDGEGAAARQADVRVTGDGVRDGEARDADDTDDGQDGDAARVSGDVTAAEAIAIALKHSPGTVVSVELDDEDDAGPVVWDVDVLAGDDTRHSVHIDPGTGKVLGTHTERDDDGDDD